MKIVVYIFAFIGLVLISLLIIGSNANLESSNQSSSINSANFNGTYNIDYGNSKCGNLGYKFKVQYEKVFDKTKNAGRINKSNCKLTNNRYEGYIYPSNKPSFRVYWEELNNGKVVHK